MRRSYRLRRNRDRATIDWSKYSRAELVTLAKSRGIRANSRWGREALIRHIGRV